MGELTHTQVATRHEDADSFQRLLRGARERGEISFDTYTERWDHAEARARHFIVGQQMFELVAGVLFETTLPAADYMQAVDRVTRNPHYSSEQRVQLQSELRNFID